MNQTATIYGLRDPQTGELRYVGKTVRNLNARLCGHMLDKEDNYRTRWIKSLGQRPLIEGLAVTKREYAPYLEKFAIAIYRSMGFRLTNLTNGGEGCEGRVLSAAGRARLSKSLKGNTNARGVKHTPEARARMSTAQRGLKKSPYKRSAEDRAAIKARQSTPEAKARTSAQFTGKPLSEERKAKLREYHAQPEVRERDRQLNLGREKSPETRAKLSAALTGRKLSPEHRAAVSRGKRSMGRIGPDTRHGSVRTHCVNGHEFSLENTYVYSSGRKAGWRKCRTCHRLQERDRQQRRRVAS